MAGDFGSIEHNLLQGFEVFNESFATRRGDTAYGLGTIAVLPFEDFDHPGFFEHLEMAAQVAVSERAQLLQVDEGQSLRISDKRGEYAEARALVNDAIEAFVGKASFAAALFDGWSLRFHRHLPASGEAELPPPGVGPLRRERPWPREKMRDCQPAQCRRGR